MYSNLPAKIDRDIAAQLKALGIGEKRAQKHQFPCITISREYGCEGIPVATQLINKLSSSKYPWVLFHRELITKISSEDSIRKDLSDIIDTSYRGLLHQYIDHLLTHKPSNVELYKKMAETLRLLGVRGRSVILGSGAAIITADLKQTLHIRMHAPIEFRTERVSKMLKISESEARKQIANTDNDRKAFIYEFTRKDVGDPHHYHLMFDNSKFDSAQISELIYQALVLRKMLPDV